MSADRGTAGGRNWFWEEGGRSVSSSLLGPCPGCTSGDTKVSQESWRIQLEADGQCRGDI